jgi:hypothetical protein
MTERDRPVLEIERWILARSGVTIVVLLMLLGVMLRRLSRLKLGLPSGYLHQRKRWSRRRPEQCLSDRPEFAVVE